MIKRILIVLPVAVLSFVTTVMLDTAPRPGAGADRLVMLSATPLTVQLPVWPYTAPVVFRELDVEVHNAIDHKIHMWQPTRSISEYDDVIRRVSRREGVDWRLLSAIAYHESRFKPHVVSSCGARGIMQIMPVVARHFDVPQDQIVDPEINVTLAAKLLKDIERSMELPAHTPVEDRISLTLASYNAGVGHMADARRRARQSGCDANSWDDVSLFLARRQTTAFVRNVMGQYSDYCLLASL